MQTNNSFTELKGLLPMSSIVESVLIPKPYHKFSTYNIYLNHKRLVKYRVAQRVYYVNNVRLSELESLTKDFIIVITSAKLVTQLHVPQEVGVFSTHLPYRPERIFKRLHANRVYVNTKIRVRGVDLYVKFLVRLRIKDMRRILVVGDKDSVKEFTEVFNRYHRNEKVLSWFEAYGAFLEIPFPELKNETPVTS